MMDQKNTKQKNYKKLFKDSTNSNNAYISFYVYYDWELKNGVERYVENYGALILQKKGKSHDTDVEIMSLSVGEKEIIDKKIS